MSVPNRQSSASAPWHAVLPSLLVLAFGLCLYTFGACAQAEPQTASDVLSREERILVAYLFLQIPLAQNCDSQNSVTATTSDQSVPFGPTSAVYAGVSAEHTGRAFVVVTVTAGQEVVFSSPSGALSKVNAPYPYRGNYCQTKNTLVTFNMTTTSSSSTSLVRQINESGTFTFSATTTASPVPSDVTVRIQ